MSTEIDPVKGRKIILGCVVGFFLATAFASAFGFYQIEQARQRQLEENAAQTRPSP